MHELLTQLQSQTSLEWLAVITGLIYVILAAKEKNACWIFGIISTACWGYASYFHYQLYVDALLQMFYVAMGFYGIYKWQFSKNNNTYLPVSKMSGVQHLIVIGIGLMVSVGVGYLFGTYTAAAATYLDSLTTVFSIAATWMTVQKKLENWIYWIVVDIIYVYLYFSREAVLFGYLMILYTIIAIIGWINWKRAFNSPATT